jgi:hypothetical protein
MTFVLLLLDGIFALEMLVFHILMILAIDIVLWVWSSIRKVLS